MKFGVVSWVTAIVWALAGSAWAAGDPKACLEGVKKDCIEIGTGVANDDPLSADELDELRADCEKTKDKESCSAWFAEAVKAGCRGGKEAACKTLGESEARERAEKAAPPIEALEANCKKKNQQACVELAVRLLNNEILDPSPQNQKRAIALLDRSCKAGFGDGCARRGLGLLFSTKAGDTKRGLKLIKHACDLGSKAGCEFQRNFRPPTIKVVPDNEAQGPGILGVLKTTEDPDFEVRVLARLLVRNCKLGYADACAELEEPEAAEKRKTLTSAEVAAKIRKLEKQAGGPRK